MGSSRLKSRRRHDQGSKLSRILISVLATIGVIDTGSITLSRWGWIGTLTCPGGSEGCDKVLNSPWGTIFANHNLEIPLSFLGLLSYIAILIFSIIPFLPWLTRNKSDVSRFAWWILFYLSNCMAIFSFILMGIMVKNIEAFCFFCILSALISCSILILTIIGGGWEDRRDLISKAIVISIVTLLGGLIWSSSVNPTQDNTATINQGIAPEIEKISSPASIELAKHLKRKNIILYNAYWCPHCHDQKEMFGKEATSNLTLIECARDGQNNQAELCQKKGISGYPSWEINGKIESGVKTLDELADLSGYLGNRNF